MKNLNLLIKPASSSCNLRCRYCFYHDVADNRKIPNYGIMSDSTLENMVKNAFQTAENSINFAFQGGEPTCAGIEFFNKFHNFVEKYNINNIMVNFSLQTNGTLINKDWITLFKKYNYLVGLSIDGNREIHDKFRLDIQGNGTFRKVLKTAKDFSKAGVEFNVLCVVNKVAAENGRLIYNFFKNNGFRYFQFIPCLDSFEGGEEDFSLTADDYGKFLNDTFDEWYKDILSGKKISIRYFDNLIRMVLGQEPEACDMVGHCNLNGIIEADGSMYPCDFYVLDEYRLGNINDTSIEELFKSNVEKEFLQTSINTNDKCKLCRYLKLCRSGCRRHKQINEQGILENRFCSSYMSFFDKNISKIVKVAEFLLKNQ